MFEILIPDPEDFDEILKWAKTCKSFISSELIDVSDVSYIVDEYGVFVFEDKDDAIRFKLVWG